MSDYSFLDQIKDYFSVSIDRKSFLMIFISVVGYLVWFLAFPLFGPVMRSYLDGMRTLAIERGRVIQIFLLGMLIFSFVTGYVLDKVLRRTLFIWVSTLIASIITYAFLFVNDILLLFPVSLVLGIVASVSPVAWGALLADYSVPEDRGRIMGASVAFTMPIAYLFFLFKANGTSSSANTSIIVVGTFLLITLATILLRPEEKTEEIKKARRRGGATLKQTFFYAGPVFLFYIVAGVLFSVVFPTIQDNVSSIAFYLTWGIPFIVGAVFGGVILDSRGRKFPMIIGLAITGVSLAVLSLLGI